jgi:hypothetical protein
MENIIREATGKEYSAVRPKEPMGKIVNTDSRELWLDMLCDIQEEQIRQLNRHIAYLEGRC